MDVSTLCIRSGEADHDICTLMERSEGLAALGGGWATWGVSDFLAAAFLSASATGSQGAVGGVPPASIPINAWKSRRERWNQLSGGPTA